MVTQCLKRKVFFLSLSRGILKISQFWKYTQGTIRWNSENESGSVMSDSLQPHGLVHGILQARILEWVAFPFSKGSSQPRDWTQVSRIAGRFFTSWATREAQNIGVGSLSLLQGIFPTQELNQGLLHCRRILYQLSYQGSEIELWLSLHVLSNIKQTNIMQKGLSGS